MVDWRKEYPLFKESLGASMEIILKIIYTLIVVYNIIYAYLPFANYLDESICILLFLFVMAKVPLRHGKFKISKVDAVIVLSSIILTAIGLLSNIAYGYANSWNTVLRDIVATFKFQFTFLCIKYISKNHINTISKRFYIVFAKCAIVLIFVFGIISLCFDIGLGEEIRYGLRSYRFLYSHYTYLVFNTVILTCTVMCGEGRKMPYYLMSSVILILTLRTKALLTIVAIFAIMWAYRLKETDSNTKLTSLIKPHRLILILPCLFMLARSKVIDYFSWGQSASIRVGLIFLGFRIMLDHFPLGSGFGTFGTNLSYKTSSKIYQKYDILNYEKLLNLGYATFSDSFWPSIYGQFGVCGFCIYLISLLFTIKSIFSYTSKSNRIQQAALCGVAYLILSSIAEASFTNESGVFVALFIGIISCFGESSETG